MALQQPQTVDEAVAEVWGNLDDDALYNGSAFATQAAGEKLREKPHHIIFYPENPINGVNLKDTLKQCKKQDGLAYTNVDYTCTNGNNPPAHPFYPPRAEFDKNRVMAMLKMALVNMHHLETDQPTLDAIKANQAEFAWTDDLIVTTAWVRAIIFGAGYVSPHLVDEHVTHKELKAFADGAIEAAMRYYMAEKTPGKPEVEADPVNNVAAEPMVEAERYPERVARLQKLLAHAKKDPFEIMLAMTNNLVGCVALVFRARGHHFMDSYEKSYAHIWSSVVAQDNTMKFPMTLEAKNTWVALAVVATHALTPARLDAVWTFLREKSAVAGTLTVRYDCGPSGGAVAYSGTGLLKDMLTAFPSLAGITGLASAVAALQEISHQVNPVRPADATDAQWHVLVWTARWRFSVNAAHYGVIRTTINEAEIAPVVALALQLTDGADPTAKLLDSPALKRVAGNALITAHVSGKIFKVVIEEQAKELAKICVAEMITDTARRQQLEQQQ